MQSRFFALVAIVAMCCGATIIQAEELDKDRLIYIEKTVYPVMEEMKKNDETQREAAAAKTEEILAAVEAENKARQEARRELRVDLSDLEKPAGPGAFTHRSWHFPPTPQYRTGTCWSFATTSFMESEIHRLSGREIKLSEMWGAYWEYVLKARGFVQTRGESHFSQGSQSAALLRVYEQFGVVPRADYEGVLTEDGRFDHDLMVERMSEFLDWCREEDFWDEEAIIGSIRLIMDATMGRPPEQVTWKGRSYTPEDFLSSVCDLDPADYVSLISTSSIPFWTRGEYAVPDNWWHDTSYVNVPLKPWFEVLKATVVEGGSLVIGGDVSEPGLWGVEDVAIIPTFDIPGEYIDQDSREFRFVNRSSTDDHLIHIVGTTTVGDRDWFLVKDSNRSSRLGTHEGYYFYREDYVRLKMLMYTVHKDRVADLLTKVDKDG